MYVYICVRNILCVDAGWERLGEVNEFPKWRWPDEIEKTAETVTWKS